jgi:hypothetical protein
VAKTAKGKSQPDISSIEDVEQSSETPDSQPTAEEIAVRAYHIYLERGGIEGDPEADWLQAERELSQNAE